jgi:hypothetical protein
VHVEQLSEVWIEPTAQSVREYASSIRAEGQRLLASEPAGVVEPAAASYAVAVAELDTLLV